MMTELVKGDLKLITQHNAKLKPMCYIGLILHERLRGSVCINMIDKAII